MGTKLNKVPTNEKELKELLQELYKSVKYNYENNIKVNITGILEIITCEANIVTAIHKIKANQGSQTVGVDNLTIQDYLDKGYEQVIEEVQDKLKNYKPKQVRRVYIPKPGKDEKRPLGIPAIIDRIIQECVRNIIEPIAEAQFFEHSYGFRPMRSADMAIARIKAIQFTAKCYYVVEGDIKGFFDNIDHNVMIKTLWNMGIKDKRVLCIIKEMLKAGVMNEQTISELGTPQGGIISPLLANIYLNRFDNHIIREFEHKKLRTKYSRRDGEINAMRNRSNLKTCYYVRYADDWVILTDNEKDAKKLKNKAQKYLKDTLKLELSEEKTLITDVRKRAMKFLGVKLKIKKLNGRWVNQVSPDEERLKRKLKELKKEIFYLRKINPADRIRLIQNIIRVNSIITGFINYYKMCDQVNVVIRVPAWKLKYTAYKSLKKFGGKWVKAKETANLIGLHSGHETHIPAIWYKGKWIGITDLAFAKWENPKVKNQLETPYTEFGTLLYTKRMNKRPLKERVDEVNTSAHAFYLRLKKSRLYTFEYFMNRPYVYNRDKGKCKICGGYIDAYQLHTHHKKKNISSDKLNKAANLISTHIYCHKLIHSDEEIPINLSVNTVKNLIKYRKIYNS